MLQNSLFMSSTQLILSHYSTKQVATCFDQLQGNSQATLTHKIKYILKLSIPCILYTNALHLLYQLNVYYYLHISVEHAAPTRFLTSVPSSGSAIWQVLNQVPVSSHHLQGFTGAVEPCKQLPVLASGLKPATLRYLKTVRLYRNVSELRV
jgi:hypothetical protein